VPNVVGQRLAGARSKLARAHCRVGRVTRRRSSAAKRGRVLAESPKAGKTLRSGARIDLKVGKGR
jgi:beta-lactam-binding protein with PASTA domain